MQQTHPKKISEISSNIKAYLSNRLDYLRWKSVEKMAKIMADLLCGFVLIFFLSIVFLAATIAVAFYLSGLLGSYALGFGAATAFLLACSLLVLYVKEKLEQKIGNISIKRYFGRHCNDETDMEHQDSRTKPCDD